MAKNNFRGMPGGMNQAAMIKQAQKMQQEMLKMQEEMEQSSYEATAGGGAVTVKMSGKKELLEIKISPDVVDADDIEMLEDLISSAMKVATDKSKSEMETKMKSVTGGVNIPGLTL